MIYEFDGFIPVVHESAFIHPQAAVTGNVVIGRDVYVGPGQLSTAPKNLLSIKGIRMACDFEGHVTFGIGIKNNVKKINYQFLSDPKRIVLDFKR